MKVFKHELAGAIKSLKAVVPKNPVLPSLKGILFNNGTLTASNTEITMQISLDSIEGEKFILPESSFTLIENLPEGEIEFAISENGTYVDIATGKIRNRFQAIDPDTFGFNMPDVQDAKVCRFSGRAVMSALANVLFATAKSDGMPLLKGVLVRRKGDIIDIVATDGHVVAWDKVDSEGEDMQVVIPGDTVKTLISMGIDDDIEFNYNKNAAIFKTSKYTVYTRLLDGGYPNFEYAFTQMDIHAGVDRKQLLNALSRAKMCDSAGLVNVPTMISFREDKIGISRSGVSVAAYSEEIDTIEDVDGELDIRFDTTILIAAIKSFSTDTVYLEAKSRTHPMIMTSDASDYKALVLPVR